MADTSPYTLAKQAQEAGNLSYQSDNLEKIYNMAKEFGRDDLFDFTQGYSNWGEVTPEYRYQAGDTTRTPIMRNRILRDNSGRTYNLPVNADGSAFIKDRAAFEQVFGLPPSRKPNFSRPAQNPMNEYGMRPKIGYTPNHDMRGTSPQFEAGWGTATFGNPVQAQKPKIVMLTNDHGAIQYADSTWNGLPGMLQQGWRVQQETGRNAQIWNPQTQRYEWRTWDPVKQQYVLPGEISKVGDYGSNPLGWGANDFQIDDNVSSFIDEMGFGDFTWSTGIK